MPTFTNREIMDKVVPALRAIGELALKPATNLLILQIRRVFEPHAALLNEVRNRTLLRHAVLTDGKLVMKEAIVVFAPDPLEHMVRQGEFNAAMAEMLKDTFDCDMTIEYDEHLSKVSVPANVLFDLGELLVLPEPEPESEPEETEEAEPEEPNAEG